MNKEVNIKQNSRTREAGFTLVESIIAIAIISIGLIGTAAAISTALKFSRAGRVVTEAKAIALAQIEQIHSLRDSRRLNFRQINNVGPYLDNTLAKVSFNGFENGFYHVSSTPGTDGIFGTSDDPASDPDKADFTRETVISNPVPNFKKIVVKVKFRVNDNSFSEITAIGYLNNDLKQK